MPKNLKILVPIDFSRHSLETLRFALSLRDYFAADYVLLHVVVAGESEAFATLGGESDEMQNRRIADAQAELEREVDRRRQEISGIQLTSRIAIGVPFKEICRLADEENFQLIVIGTHGRTGLSHLLIGSTAERVVQHASCPVLSIKPQVL
jgi:nucleotide-binding universal stress UspA family protein